MTLESILARALNGIGATVEEALHLNDTCTTDTLCEAADRVRRERCGNRIDTCSIVNAADDARKTANGARKAAITTPALRNMT